MQRSILIDASHWRVEQPTGVEVYVNELLPHLFPALKRNGFNSIYLLGDKPSSPVPIPDYVEWVYRPYQRGWSQFKVLDVIKELKPAIYFTPSGIPPLQTRVATAMMVHDLAVYEVPAAYGLGERFRLQILAPRAAKRAKTLFVPSLYTQTELIRRWRIKPDQITVTPLALPEVSVEMVKPSFKIGQSAIVYIGRLERKKNLEIVIRAFSTLKSPEGAQLVLAGGNGFGSEQIHQLITNQPAPVRERIIVCGYLSQAEKYWLLNRAAAMVAPCPVEGFGLPALEAFQAHLPLVTVTKGALAEVAEAAALKVEPDSLAAWVEALEKILTDRNLREELRLAGSKRLQHYNWSKTADQTASALSAILDR